VRVQPCVDPHRATSYFDRQQHDVTRH